MVVSEDVPSFSCQCEIDEVLSWLLFRRINLHVQLMKNRIEKFSFVFNYFLETDA